MHLDHSPEMDFSQAWLVMAASFLILNTNG